MQFGINLLPVKKTGLERKKFWRKIKLIGGSVLGLYIFLIIGLLTASFLISSSGKKIKQDLARVQLEAKGLEKQESLEIALKGRAEAINKLLKVRVDQKELLAGVQNFVLPGITLSGITLSGEKINFAGEAQDIKTLSDFLDQFDNQDKKISYWSKIKLNALSRTLKGTYDFSFEATPVLK